MLDHAWPCLTMFDQWRVVYWTGLDEWDSPVRPLPAAPGPHTRQATIRHVSDKLANISLLPQRNYFWWTSRSAYFYQSTLKSGESANPPWPCGVPTSQAAVNFQFRLRPDKRIKKFRVHKPGEWWPQYSSLLRTLKFADYNGTIHILYSPLIPHS